MPPRHKTKIVCTIGPASSSAPMLERLVRNGMAVARVNLAHGTPDGHRATIALVREAARAQGRTVAVLADLPGPKMRIGQLASEPMLLERGARLALTTKGIVGTPERISVSFRELPRAVKAGDKIFLNDGFIELGVDKVVGEEVLCRVLVGGTLRSHKGVNVPGIDLGIAAVTDHDRALLQLALDEQVDAVSVSFVERAADLDLVRATVAARGRDCLVVAKIERARALDRIEEILQAADAIMVARGDLGVEIPIERIAVVQKQLAARANALGKPVIVATQMLESMTDNPRPTRAEVTDVANAILDGADCVMLSEETATGRYPAESVATMGRIAVATEPLLQQFAPRADLQRVQPRGRTLTEDVVALQIYSAVERLGPAAVIVPTESGATARRISRFRLPIWVFAMSPNHSTCQQLQLSWGVHPVEASRPEEGWTRFGCRWLREHGFSHGLAIVTRGPSRSPGGTNSLEIVSISKAGQAGAAPGPTPAAP